jgi:type I site-specific restriction-modification system R (restriction) subunit
MSKKTSYTNGNYSINGETKSTTRKKGSTVYGNYNMNNAEKTVYNYAQKTLAEILPQINTFSDSTMADIQSQLNAYQNQGEKTINNIYTPLLKNLKSDIASRFGNIDNSMFLDKLNSIESSRSDAISQLAESILSKKSDLINNELSNRYNLVNLLNTLQNQYNNNALSAISSVLSLANSAKSSQSSSSGLDLSSLVSLLGVL